MTNLEWIRRGNTGCVFATLFAKHPEVVGWKFISYKQFPFHDANLLSIIFPPHWNKEMVLIWALNNNFYIENTGKRLRGLRYDCTEGKSWVQYFGKDSHVKTRRAPYPMLMFTQRLNKTYYIKVGFKGILHLAHAWSETIKENVYDLLWQQSYKQTARILGHNPTIREAAKTTFEDE